MAKLNFVKNGVVTRLPPGFRFHPTDEELVVQYLKRKAFSVLLPANIISEVDVYKFDPWDLPGNLEEERYFFSRNEAKHLNGKRSKRGTASGYWKATGTDKQILTSRSSQAVGKKKTLVFYKGKPPNGKRTDWIMHEYRLSLNEASEKSSTQSLVVPVINWVLCRIFLKKRSTKNTEDEQELSSIGDGSSEKAWTNRPVLHNFMTKVGRTDLNLLPPPSSCSSGVTEISSDKFDEQEESSIGCNNGRSFDLTRRL